MRLKDNLLERVIKEAETTPHPSPFDKRLLPWWEGPWFDMARVAVGSLKNIGEIKEFMKEYIKHIQEKYELSQEEAAKSAKSAIGYCTGYVDNEQANIWFNALADISHPVMGRKRPFVIDEEADMFYLIGKSRDEEVRRYVVRDFESGIIGFRLANPPITQGKDNSEYFAVRIKPSNFFSVTDCYMFLIGYSQGVPAGMQEEIGKSCELMCEIKKRDKKR